MLIYSIAFTFIAAVCLQQANGQTYLTTNTVAVPYAQKYTFTCPTTADSWHFKQPNATDETQIAANDTFIIDTSAGTLTIKETRKDQLSVDYVCKAAAGKYLFKLIPQPYMYALEKASVTVTEGGMATATCKLIVGFSRNESVVWSWLLGGQPLPTNDSRISVTNAVDNSESKLSIKTVVDSDKGTYQCVAVNSASQFTVANISSTYNHTITIRVKSTLAALWPFLAIIGEVIILCLIILIFEKKCGKKSSQEGKEEQSDTLLNKQKESENSDVKKRSVKA